MIDCLAYGDNKKQENLGGLGGLTDSMKSTAIQSGDSRRNSDNVLFSAGYDYMASLDKKNEFMDYESERRENSAAVGQVFKFRNMYLFRCLHFEMYICKCVHIYIYIYIVYIHINRLLLV